MEVTRGNSPPRPGEWTVSALSRWKNFSPTPSLVTSEGMKCAKRFPKNAKFSRTVSPKGTNRKKPVSIPEKRKVPFSAQPNERNHPMNFVVALKAEATPLVESFELAKENAPSPFPIFANDRHRLVLSGVGKELASKATNFLSERFSNPNQAWMNFGLSRHGDLATGTVFMANRIVDDDGKAHSTRPNFLTMISNPLPCRPVPLLSLVTPIRLGTTWKPLPSARVRPLLPSANSSKWSRSYPTTRTTRSAPLTAPPSDSDRSSASINPAFG